MVNTELLQDAINKSGITLVFIAESLGITREALYRKIRGLSEFKASEIVAMTRILHLTRPQRDSIFLPNG